MEKEILLIGCGGHAKVCMDVILESKKNSTTISIHNKLITIVP